MKNCPFCGEPLPVMQVKFCPECGARLPVQAERETGGDLWEQSGRSGPGRQAGARVRRPDPYTLNVPDQRQAPEDASPSPEDLWERALREADALPRQAPQDMPAPGYAAGDSSNRPEAEAVPERFSDEPAAWEERMRPDLPEADPAMGESRSYGPPVSPEPDETYWDDKDAPEEAGPALPKRGKTKGGGKEPKAPAQRVRKTRKGSGVGKILLIVALSLVVLAGGAGYLVLRMNAQDAPKKAAESFAKAVFAGDVTAVMAQIETAGSGLSSAEAVKKMCEDLRAETDPNTFAKHLLGTLGEKDGAALPELSCFTMKQTKDNLIAQEFQVKISAVQVLVEAGLEDVALYVDGGTKPASPQASDGGLLLQLAPGIHTIEAFYEGYGQKDPLGSASVHSFALGETQRVSVQKNMASAVIELAGTETNVQVLVNGSKFPLDAGEGFVEVNPAFVGMKITVRSDQYTQEFEVTAAGDQSFTVDYIAELEGKNPGGQTADPLGMSNRQLMDHLSTRFYAFYASYLEAINLWDKTKIKHVSEAYYDEVVAKMEAYNSGLTYKFYGVTFDRRSLRRVEKNGELYATFSVQPGFDYAYKDRPEDWLKGGNSQTVTMHFDRAKSQWVVTDSVIVNDLAFSDNRFTINA